jgi:hypothetical protein
VVRGELGAEDRERRLQQRTGTAALTRRVEDQRGCVGNG